MGRMVCKEVYWQSRKIGKGKNYSSNLAGKAIEKASLIPG
jgi:hypothetical protein